MSACLFLEGYFHCPFTQQIVFEFLFYARHGARRLGEVPHLTQRPKVPALTEFASWTCLDWMLKYISALRAQARRFSSAGCYFPEISPSPL